MKEIDFLFYNKLSIYNIDVDNQKVIRLMIGGFYQVNEVIEISGLEV